MKIAIFGRTFSRESEKSIQEFIQKTGQLKADLLIYNDLRKFLKKAGIDVPDSFHVFKNHSDLPEDTDFLFSFGGDGTFLQTVNIVGDSGIPVIGINAGRLGFLTSISAETLSESLDLLFTGRYIIEERTLLQLEIKDNKELDKTVALNEITIHKKDIGMITIHVEIDGEFLNSYWADGLIISTPTGSTAYSMSVGGPIILPDSGNFIISPVSPHNLTVRPLVIPDSKSIKLKVSSRSSSILVAHDSKSASVPTGSEILIKKAGYKMKLVRIHGSSFYNTLRNKLMWGMDKRN